MDEHAETVAIIADQVRQFHERNIPFRIYHGSTSSTRPPHTRRDPTVDTSKLSNVMKVDPVAKTILVEPNVPMDGLVAATLQHGLVPAVVMEFPGITAGGGFSGTSGESSSFKYGFFEDTVQWIEMVLANGEIVNASSSENSDLFQAAGSSCGTLGVTTLLEIQLLEAKTYVELTYHPISSMAEAVHKIEHATETKSCHYLDGIMFAKDKGVICTGRLADTVQEGIQIQRFTRAQDPWFYCHAEKIVNSYSGSVTEAIPLVDYLFRYDRGTFWGGRYAFKYFLAPFNRITRFLLDRFMHTRVMYHALHKSGLAKRYMVQDVGVPIHAAEEFLEFLDHNYRMYPLWLCPLQLTARAKASPYHSNTKADMLLNFGVWGPGPADLDGFVDANRRLEQKVLELDGLKALYAHTYYTEEEFWEIYDKRKYNAIRAKFHAEYLPTIYDKAKVDVDGEKKALKESWRVWLLDWIWSIWPLMGLYGVLYVLLSGKVVIPQGRELVRKGGVKKKD